MEDPSGTSAAAEAEMHRLEESLRRRVPDLSLSLATPLRDYQAKYTWVPGEIAASSERLKQESAEVRRDYCRYLLSRFIASFAPTEGRYRLPPSIVALYPAEIERIWRQIDGLEDSYFDIGDDRFLKDLAILTHRLIPVGAEYAEGEAGIPRRLFFSGGLGQFFRMLWLVGIRCGGLRPFFALHAHILALDAFTPDGWIASYHRLAELLVLNPELRGWLSSSWFLDPALEAVSPHLTYLREVPVQGGAALMFVCRDREGDSGALSKSATRRRLFAEGKYLPAIYQRVWPRESAIAWSRQKAKQAGTQK